MTSDLYSRMLWLKPQESAGTLSSDAIKLLNEKVIQPGINLATKAMGIKTSDGGGEG